MSDILLSVGLQTGAAETSQLQSDLQQIISRIDKNPPKVKVGLQVDQSALNHFKSQLTQIVNSVGLSKGAPITVNISGLGEISAQAGKAKQALDGVAKSGKAAADTINNMSGKKAADSLTQINNQIMLMQANLAKWTAAQNGDASASYAAYSKQLTALMELKTLVEQNAISAEDFALRLSNIKAAASEAAAAIKGMGEDHAAKSVEKLTEDSEAYNTALGKTETLLAQVKKRQIDWTAAKNGKSSAAYKALTSYQRDLEDLISKLMTGKMTADKFAAAFANISAKVKTAEGTIRSCGENTKTLGDRLKGLAEKFSAWLSVSQVIMMAVRAIRQMVAAVREVDAAMTELKKVTNATDAKYTQFLSNATNRAKALGAALSDVVSATADFARLGYSIDEASAMADAALVYKNVGDGIKDINEASESIIATMQAFGINAKDVMQIVDKFNKVGNNYAISSAGVGDALLRSAAAMHAANNTLDETIALAAAANTIVQDPDKVGTTLKTVSMYLRAAKTEAEEAGEATDGMAGSVSELRQEILDLTGQKVDIQIDEDTFKSTYRILQELSKVWGELSDVSQANILELVGGKRNSNVVAALLENFSVAEKAVTTSAEAAGSALQENEIYLDSINGKLQTFKATFETFSTNFISSDFVKDIVDLGTGLLNILNAIAKVVEAIGGLNTVLMATVGIIATIKADSIVSFLSGIIPKIISLGGAVKGFFVKIKDLPLAMKMAKAEGKGLSAALEEVGVSASTAQLAIGALVAILMVATIAINKYNHAQEERRSADIANGKAVREEADSLSGLIDQYKKLAESEHWDDSSRSQAKSLQEQITKLVGDQAENLDLVNGKLDDEIEKLEEILLKQAEANTGQLLVAKKSATDNLIESAWGGGLKEVFEINADISFGSGWDKHDAFVAVLQELEMYDKYYSGDGFWVAHESADEVLESYADMVKLQEHLVTNYEEEISHGGDLKTFYDNLSARINSMRTAVNEYNEAITNYSENEAVKELGNYLKTNDINSKQAFDDYINGIQNSTEYSESYKRVLIDLANQTFPQFANAVSDATAGLNTSPNEWDGWISAIQELLSGDNGIETVGNDITTLTDALNKLDGGTLELEEVVELIEQFPELAPYVDYTAENFGNLGNGIKAVLRSSPDKLVDTLLEFKEVNNLTGEAAEKIDILIGVIRNMPTDSVESVAEEFGVLKQAINDATKAQNELEAALAEDDWDAGYEGRVKAFEEFQESYDAGEYGSKAFAAYKEYFGLMEKSPEQIKEWMDANKKYFTEGTDGVLAFLQTVESMSGPGGALDGIASFDADTGEFWYDINELSAFADQLGWTEEMLQDFIYKYRMYCDAWESRSPADSMKELSNAGLISTEYADFGPTIASLQDLMEHTGLSEQGVYDLIDSINELRKQDGLPEISLIGRDITEVTQESITRWQNLGATAEEVTNLIIDLAEQGVKIKPNLWIDTTEGPQLDVDTILAEAGIEDSETVHVEVDFKVNGEAAMATVEATVAEVKAILGEDWEVKLAANTVDAETGLTAVQTLLTELPPSTDVLLLDSTGLARSSLSQVVSLLDTIENNNTKTVTIRYKTIGLPMFADGTKRAKSGPALLGDEYSPSGSPKPELVVSGDRAYIAGANGPEVGYLHDGDVVYTADETKRILGMNSLHGSIPAHAGGTAGGLVDTGGLSGGNYNFTGGGSSSNKSGDDEESWFERQYKDHNHWLEMDKESVADYLEWLNGAYQQAYAEGIIDLDEYYKYQEEVYKGVQDLFKDHLNDIDHEMSLLEGAVGSSDEVIALAVQAMADIEKELAAARAAGLDENGDYIQWLEQQWADYSETVIDLREQAETEAKNSVDDLVEYRIDMLKKEIENEKDALDKKLSDLQDFYDKQRKMLQDQYDEEKYLEEQKEKRKSVTDIQSELAMLENDDSAWAQKRKLELQAELSDAEKELNSFEKDHALNMTLDMLDEQQAAQEAQIQAQMDALDEKLNDPHALFNQALEDIKNNTAELYQEFIEYNRQHGTGNDEDVAELWEEAYKADQEYKDTHDGESKDGIEIGNYTGYVVPENPAPPQPEPEPENPAPEPEPEPEPEKSYPYGKASDTSGDIGVGSSGTKVKAIQYALNELGFGNSGTQGCDGQFGSGTQSAVKAFQRAMGVSADGIVGKNTRAKFKAQGYATGTDNATPGWHEVDELGAEYLFVSPSDGTRYRMFTGGEKVLNADATNFLYDFATTGGGVLTKMLADLFGQTNFGNISKPIQAIEIHAGDVNISGNASERTVSEIRRAQRENIKFVISEFNKLNK